MALKNSSRIADSNISSVSAKPTEINTPTRTGADILRETFNVSGENGGNGRVYFSLSEVSMKGVSRQVAVDLRDLPGFITTLRRLYEEGPSSAGDNNVGKSAVETFHATIRKNDEGRVYFRTMSGKGMKPTSLPEADLPVLVNFLRSKRPALIRAYNAQTGANME